MCDSVLQVLNKEPSVIIFHFISACFATFRFPFVQHLTFSSNRANSHCCRRLGSRHSIHCYYLPSNVRRYGVKGQGFYFR